MKSNTIALKFSEKYDQHHSKNYFEKHDKGVWRRLSNWRDQGIARKALALAGNPQSILDVPCGTGRFWNVLAEDTNREIHVCDNSQDMIDAGFNNRPKQITERILAKQGCIFNLPYDDNFVESIFCIRLFHHIGNENDRLKALAELKRVSASTIIISLWVDGNFQAWRRIGHEQRRQQRKYQNRFVIATKKIEDEFKKTGLTIDSHLDFFKGYSMWRTYVLRKT